MILSSDWMPYLYVRDVRPVRTGGRVVAAGAARDAWIVALAGWFLIHGHAAFLFFVPGMTVVVLAALCWPRRRASGGGRWTAVVASLRAFLGRHRRTWIPAAAISAVFLLPIVINLALHWPGSFGKYFSYGSSSQAGGHSVGAVMRVRAVVLVAGAPRRAYRFVGSSRVLSYAVAVAPGVVVHPGLVRRFLLTLLGRQRAVLRRVRRLRGGRHRQPDQERPLHRLLLLVGAAADRWSWRPWPWPRPWARRCPDAARRVLADRRRGAGRGGAIAAFAAAPLARTSTSYSDPAAPWMSPPDTDAAIPGAVATLAARSPGKTLVLKLDHSAWEDLTGFLVQAERTGVRACVDDPHWEFMVTSQFICTPHEAAAGARYYFHFTGVPEHGQVDYPHVRNLGNRRHLLAARRAGLTARPAPALRDCSRFARQRQECPRRPARVAGDERRRAYVAVLSCEFMAINHVICPLGAGP